MLVTTKQQLKEIISKHGYPDNGFAIDTETDGLNFQSCRMLGISIAFSDKEGYYIPIKENQAKTIFNVGKTYMQLWEVQEVLAPLFASEAPKYLHNAKFDMWVLDRHGLPLGDNIVDTMLGAWVKWNQKGKSYALKSLIASVFQKETITYKEMSNRRTVIPIEQMEEYASNDTIYTYQLAIYLYGEMNKTEQNVWDLENKLLPVLYSMEKEGVYINRYELNKLKSEMEGKKAILMKEIRKITKIDINSPQKLSILLYNELKLPTFDFERGKNGYYPTGKGELERLKGLHPIVDLLLQYRKIEKLLTTYYHGIPKLLDSNSVLHTIYSSISYDGAGGITSGRLSSREPNLQNIPSDARRMFESLPDHKYICIDYAQQEVRIPAYEGNDIGLIDKFKKGKIDPHIEVMYMLNHDKPDFPFTLEECYKIYKDYTNPNYAKIKEERRLTKAVTFGVAYGKTIYGLARDLGMTEEEAQDFIDNYFIVLPGVKRHLDNTTRKLRKQGYVETFFGRRRYFDIKYGNFDKMKREAINMPIQGGGADIVKLAMVKCFNFLKGYKTKLVMQVHDELIFHAPDSEVEFMKKELLAIMENIVQLTVPFQCDVEVGTNWKETH